MVISCAKVVPVVLMTVPMLQLAQMDKILKQFVVTIKFHHMEEQVLLAYARPILPTPF